MRVRAITADDADLYRSILERTSDEDRYCRFFHVIDHLAPQHIARFVTPADDMVGFIALDDKGRALGAGHAILSSPEEGEIAIVVAQDARRAGVGLALMTYLIAALQARGCRRVFACALWENRALANLAKAVGMKSRRHSGNVVEWALDARDTPRLRAGVHANVLRSFNGSSRYTTPLMNHRVYVPNPLHDERGLAPLLVALHGAGQTPDDFAAGTNFDEVAQQAGAYVLYPEQTRDRNSMRAWNWFLPEHQRRGAGEPAAILALVDEMCARYPIDRNRVFVAGLSAGGAMAAILAEVAPDIFTGAGIVAGVALHSSHDMKSAFAAMHGEATVDDIANVLAHGARDPRDYQRSRISIWTGGDDKIVDPDNARVLARQFHRLLGLAGPPAIETRADARITRWRNSSGNVRIELWQVPRMGHAWSGGTLRGSHTFPAGPNASSEMFDFFLPTRERQGQRQAAFLT